MRLPNVQFAVVEEEKVVDYLLYPAHPDNRGKALFFLGLGFRRDEWRPLAAAFRKVAEGHLVAKQQFSFWLVWEVRCPLFRVFHAAYEHPPFVPFVPFVP